MRFSSRHDGPGAGWLPGLALSLWLPLAAFAQDVILMDDEQGAIGGTPSMQDALAEPGAVGAGVTGDILIDRIVALVDEDVIMLSELDERVGTLKRQLGERTPPDEILERQVLERLILEQIQVQLAEKLGIRVDDLTLNRAMQDIAQRNGMPLGTFRERLIADGIDYDGFREQVRKELLISRLRQRQIDSRIEVTDQEIDDYIASQNEEMQGDVEYRLAQVLVAVPEAASPEQIREAQTRAEALRERVLAGEDFATVAASESDGQNALEGGDLGWRQSGQLPTLFSRSVALMEPGDVSELIRSPSGFHLVKLVDRRGGSQTMVTETHARHILVRPNALLPEEEAQALIAELRTQLEDGADFDELARQFSDDKSSAARGGDLGWAEPGNFVPAFEKVMNALRVDEISEPFKSEFGWHIVQVLERRSEDATRDELREQARIFIRERKQNEETEVWLRRLRDEAYVEYRLDEDASPDRADQADEA
jgi:peptidyl-prolyl cis-trans isomerase SurA